MRMHACVALILVLCAAAVPDCSAQQIADPENVTRMDVVVAQSGKIFLRASSGAATAEDLTLRLYVPQNDSRQRSVIGKVIGPDSHGIVYDSYGNAQIELAWKKPRLDIDMDYLVETAVSTDSGESGEERSFPVTAMVEADSAMIEAAYAAANGKSGGEAALFMAAWVNENTAYDLSCEDEAYAAKWVFREKRGTCDEFSSLLLSMLRATGYDAWYAAGYAYLGGRQPGESSFGSHAWVEARIGAKTYGMDPTWAESPLDATHITFARLPDANFTEHTSVRSRDVSIEWEKDETRITISDYEESPRVQVSLSAFPEEVEGGKSAIIQATLSGSGCVLTSARFSSCVNEDGSDMLNIGEKTSAAVFCGENEMYAIAGTPEVRRGMKYTCPVVFSAGGAREKVALSITSESSGDAAVLVATKKMLLPGEEFTAAVSLSGKGLPGEMRVFALLGGELTEGAAQTGGEGAQLSLRAPAGVGEHALSVIAETGDLKEETITVISERSMRITGIEHPSALREGDDCEIAALLSNAGDEDTASVMFSVGGGSETQDVSLPGGGNASASFNCTGQGAGRYAISVSLIDSGGSYQDSWTGSLEVQAPPSFKDDAVESAENFILWLIAAIRGFLGM
ncbi:MAG: transglutaminase family protein [Candidatus Aenigmatarchaeota archaeon]